MPAAQVGRSEVGALCRFAAPDVKPLAQHRPAGLAALPGPRQLCSEASANRCGSSSVGRAVQPSKPPYLSAVPALLRARAKHVQLCAVL